MEGATEWTTMRATSENDGTRTRRGLCRGAPSGAARGATCFCKLEGARKAGDPGLGRLAHLRRDLLWSAWASDVSDRTSGASAVGERARARVRIVVAVDEGGGSAGKVLTGDLGAGWGRRKIRGGSAVREQSYQEHWEGTIWARGRMKCACAGNVHTGRQDRDVAGKKKARKMALGAVRGSF